MKKMLSFALLLAMVASFPSCKDDSQPNLTDDTFSTSVTEEQNTVSPDEETTIPEETSTAPTDEEETLSQEDSIKNAVIDLMTNGKSQKDPAELLAHFSGSETKVGFIHVPYCTEQKKEPSMPLEDIIKGLTVAVESLE